MNTIASVVDWFVFTYLRSFFFAALGVAALTVLALPLAVETNGYPVFGWGWRGN